MAAGVLAPTIPFCGACGWDHELQNKNVDFLCDSCGADVTFYGFSTVATAGIPGSFDAGAPSNFAALVSSGIVASPLTAWTIGQDVDLGDGTTAFWNATAWVVGTAS